MAGAGTSPVLPPLRFPWNALERGYGLNNPDNVFLLVHVFPAQPTTVTEPKPSEAPDKNVLNAF
jgi:hypothetical protein